MILGYRSVNIFEVLWDRDPSKAFNFSWTHVQTQANTKVFDPPNEAQESHAQHDRSWLRFDLVSCTALILNSFIVCVHREFRDSV